MDDKTLTLLEFPKILDKLAGLTAFSASAEKAHLLRPTNDLFEARRRQAETSEAVALLVTHPDLTIGGARDIRQPVDLAQHGGVLTPVELMDVKSTLVAARTLARTFERLQAQFPLLADIAGRMPQPAGLIEAITRAISERGEILDSASDKLGSIRHELLVTRDRLLAKLQHMVTDPKISPMLQEALVTQRDGRFVLPLRAEFKGRVRSIVHDQSASGATLFVEPLGVVELNNRNRELQLAERDEERRILTELSHQVGTAGTQLLGMVDDVAELDLAFARGRYADELGTCEPVLREFPPQQENPASGSRHPGSVIRFVQARHPLIDPGTVVPIDVELDSQTFVLVITGPNTGGKTVTLKTVGLLALMAQAGLHIPAHSGAEISIFDQVFADIGDEQSIEQSLSTFSGHVKNIVRILSEADAHSLILLDELGAGTDPQEGAALARAILEHILSRGITTLVTTHHPELKAYAHAKPGVVNASVEFDIETLRPTFHLTIGLPGRSNALAIAQRLGMPDEIISTARAELSPEDLRAEDLLDEIHRQRDLAREARTAAEGARREAEQLRAELARRLDAIEDERRQTLESARRESQVEVEALQNEMNEVRRLLAHARQPLDALEPVEEKVEELEDAVAEPVSRNAPALSLPRQRSIRLGEKVRVRSLNAQGVVTVLGEEEAEVQVGMLRIRARLSDLELFNPGVIAEPRPVSARPTPVETLLPASPGMEIDLRGQRADEADEALERYLDSAYVSGLPFVRIIHGKGTGKLRDVVRQALQRHPHVRSFAGGSEKEGGEGVTVVKLA
jgi:DNA mismatch repair protein MutS2